MTDIELSRGSTSTRNLNLTDVVVESLPATFQVIFSVKKILDADITDSKAVIVKSFDFPADFTLSEGVYSADLVFTSKDTTQAAGEYVWNIRFIKNTELVADSKNGTLTISLSTTQRQTEIV